MEGDVIVPRSRRADVTACLANWHLVGGLALVFLVGLVWPAPGEAVSGVDVRGERVLRSVAVVLLFVAQGLTLETPGLLDAVRSWQALLIGLLLALAVTPMLGLAVARLPLRPAEFARGFTVALAAPAALTFGVVAERAGGSRDQAIVLAAASNILGVFTVPFVLSLCLDGAAAVDPLLLLLRLVLVVLLPLAAAKTLREVLPTVRECCEQSRCRLSLPGQGRPDTAAPGRRHQPAAAGLDVSE
eukprot:TRINITY_DN14793_c0_g1_i1.p1 TRINITY_DN14793_c0_g1~~TRINITY_DN14793_c0_g1_i1.p1  ORF type:complete len:265 (+),score=78.06 TRINITY_DN14793_c0_g1_i1:65-796(+)